MVTPQTSYKTTSAGFLKVLKHYIAKRGNHEDRIALVTLVSRPGELHPLPLAEPLFIAAPVTVIHQVNRGTGAAAPMGDSCRARR